MIKYLQTTTQSLTPKLAHEVANMNAWDGERALQKRRIAFLEKMLNDGLFYSPRWSFVKVQSHGNLKFRMNGQHSSHVLASRGGPFPRGLVAIMDEFSASDDNEVAELFALFDTQQSLRNRAEVTNAHARCHRELDAASPTTLTAIASGIAYGLDDGKTPRSVMRASDTAKLLHGYTKFAQWAISFAGSKKWLKRASVIGCMFRTHEVCPISCDAFWALVRDESHAERKHSSRVLADFLRDSVHTLGAIRRSDASKWTSRAFYVKCIHAWNAYRSGSTTDLKYHRNAGIPKVL